ncbi:prolyl oligopeptidase family serine peptidase [Brevundimonas sp.]|uniref:prolyl oligopeptidase family serine peptidase n=1 Tax=Brevundimonas sp. TaxID=1871086 RepID=UPI003AFF6BB9
MFGAELLCFKTGANGAGHARTSPSPTTSPSVWATLPSHAATSSSSTQGFLVPPTLSLADANAATLTELKSAPPKFDASRDITEQYEATSTDGTKIPYFITRPRDMKLDGSNPTIMLGYGGFQVSLNPAYKPEMGKLWLERGGVFVQANIRGGGEFGPDWHQAALKENRQRAFDDFAAVARDLEQRGVTSPRRLGIYGRSNGGVLTSVSITQHPELFNAAVIESPLVDMLRYHELPAGASWIGEYGDPRIPEEAAWIAKYSAYQQLRPGARLSARLSDHQHPRRPGPSRPCAQVRRAPGRPGL